MKYVKSLHAHLIITGFQEDRLAMAKVLASYALSTAHVNNARLVFKQIKEPTIFIWNMMIRGLTQSDRPKDAVVFYNKMRQKGLLGDNLTFPFVLKACGRLLDIGEGKKVHLHGLKLGFGSDVYVSNALIHMYALCGDVGCALGVFNVMPERDLVSWNSLICGYSQNNKPGEVLSLFEAMQEENVKADEVTMVKVLLACSHLGDWELADSMVKYVEVNGVKMDVYLGNTLVDVYGRCGSVDLARKVFDKMLERNIVSWNAMITGYAKAGDLVSAQKLFNDMPERNVISWTSMICGYSQASRHSEALTLFRQMMLNRVKPDEVTIASALSACAHLGTHDVGMSIHGYIRENNIKVDVYMENSLIDMYCKCGCLNKALEVFCQMTDKSDVSWNSIISGFAVNGNSKDALETFSLMLSEGVRPTSVTFIGVLLACSHGGLVDKGFEYFESMNKVYNIEPQMKHYGCMVDLLSRSGNLEQAYEFITKMPMDPDPVVWRTLLSACKVHSNVRLAETVTKKLLELDPSNSGNYILLSNTYSGADQWNAARKVRKLMEENDLQKIPGFSSIEVNGTAI